MVHNQYRSIKKVFFAAVLVCSLVSSIVCVPLADEAGEVSVKLFSGEDTGQQTGDVNADGIIDLLDVQLILRKYLQAEGEDKVPADVCDVDGSSSVDLSDVQLVLQKYLDLIDDFPVKKATDSPTPSKNPELIQSDLPIDLTHSEIPLPGKTVIPAEDSTEYRDITISADMLYLFGESANDGEVIIPATFTYRSSHFKVTGIAQEGFKSSIIKTISIPDTVTYIGARAFQDCERLQQIRIPDSVITVGENAFTGTLWLKQQQEDSDNGLVIFRNMLLDGTGAKGDVVIPDGVTKISERAFYGCGDITGIRIPEGITTIEEQTFEGCNNLIKVMLPDSTERLGNSVFSGCSSLMDIELSKNLTWIGSNAFSGCSSLERIELPDHIIDIGEGAFSNCSSLADINIPERIKAISYNMLQGCSSLTEIEIPSNVTEIRGNAFKDCIKLDNIRVSEQLTEIGRYAFEGTAWMDSQRQSREHGLAIINHILLDGTAATGSVVVPEGVTRVNDYAFFDNKELTEITFSERVTYIGYSAFCNCSSLTNIIFPQSQRVDVFSGGSISGYAFYGCSSLTDIDIPDGVRYIGSGAFWNCVSLENVSIPKSVNEIRENAFYGCKGLKTLVLPEGVAEVYDYAFGGCTGLTEVYLPGSLMYVWSRAFVGCDHITDVYYNGTKEGRDLIYGEPLPGGGYQKPFRNNEIGSALWHYTDE